ncbi:hypothetical protein AURDEDRAFT_114290 [Auricularia subglabra TFB-10046 SS5]|uniref:DUF7330 domain-containing protein n=1 Tax=Auricularia subglabra (strain TFB-10046 / SS5) TaxID=717982 RepID=J0WXJ0_AURST|nr:hypothetical protein AURDEDRAFT_114290 [Auricularia subglabra TFB-10046 SS5]
MAVDSYDSPVDESKVPLLPTPSSNPPPYQPASTSTPSTSAASGSCPTCSAGSGLKHVAPPLLPCNYYAVRRKGGGKVGGSMVIDPSASIPGHLLMPLPKGKKESDRENLAIAVPYDAVDIDVWICDRAAEEAKSSKVLPPEPSSSRQRATVSAQDVVRINVEGLTTQLRLHDMGGRLCDLTVKGHSATRLALPRSFRGPLTLYTNGTAPEFSPALRVNVTMFYEDDAHKHHCKYVRKCFIGEYGAEQPDPPKWTGSTVDVISPGSTYIYYEDEQPPPPFTRWEMFLHKLASFGPETPDAS